MCTIHQLFSDSLIAGESFPKRNSLVRAPTIEELAEHTKVRIRVRRTRSVSPLANRIISDDDDDEEGSRSHLSGVAGLPVGAPRSLIVLPRTTLCPAAAGSAAQLADKEPDDPGSVTDVDEQLAASPSGTINPASSDQEEDNGPLGFLAAVLDAMENYVQESSLPWKVKTILPGLMDFLPGYSRSMLATNLISYLRGAKTAADIIVRISLTRAPVRCQGYDVIPLDGRSSALLRASGVDTAECLE